MWIKKFLLGRTQRVRIGGQLSEEVTVRLGIPEESALGPLLFPAYVNCTWRNIESTFRLSVVDCVILSRAAVCDATHNFTPVLDLANLFRTSIHTYIIHNFSITVTSPAIVTSRLQLSSAASTRLFQLTPFSSFFFPFVLLLGWD